MYFIRLAAGRLYIFIYIYFYIASPEWLQDDCLLRYYFDRKKPPPPGGFPIYYLPSSKTLCKRAPPEDFLLEIRGGSSYTRFLMREDSK